MANGLDQKIVHFGELTHQSEGSGAIQREAFWRTPLQPGARAFALSRHGDGTNPSPGRAPITVATRLARWKPP